MATNNRLVGIHQPNFFPWLGYFDKIRRSDIFIVLDNVQFPTESWCNRTKLIIGGKEMWVTMPIARSQSMKKIISETEIVENTHWRKMIVNSLQMNYGSAPFFKSIFPFLEGLLKFNAERVAHFNFNAIESLLGLLQIPSEKLVKASNLKAEGTSSDLLISLIKSVGGSAYLCGGGSHQYLEAEKFQAAKLDLIFQNFRHPVYTQFNQKTFTPGLSIVDALMNCGAVKTRKLLEEN